jgi:CAAX prenyl protease-like protein
MSREAWARIIPFAVFMGFIGLQQALSWSIEQGFLPLAKQQLLYLYPIKALLVGALLFFFRRVYTELRFSELKNMRHLSGSLALGVLVFVLWINMDWKFATFGDNPGFDPGSVGSNSRNFLIFFRIMGAVLVVPVMEELFWRSFLLRYIIDPDFTAVRIGTFTLSSFLIAAVLFGFEHHLILAGIMAGMAYSLLLYWSRSLIHCVLAHGVTNLLLAFYVLASGNWQFW